jgi:hypothetical protein
VGGTGLQYECMSTWHINSSVYFSLCVELNSKGIFFEILPADLAMVEKGLLDIAMVPQKVKVLLFFITRKMVNLIMKNHFYTSVS